MSVKSDKPAEEIPKPEVKKKKSKKKKELTLSQKFMKSLTDIMSSPISRYTTIGASFRYFG